MKRLPMRKTFAANLRACEIAALRIGDVFDAEGGVRDTVHLRAAQTKGNEAATVWFIPTTG